MQAEKEEDGCYAREVTGAAPTLSRGDVEWRRQPWLYYCIGPSYIKQGIFPHSWCS